MDGPYLTCTSPNIQRLLHTQILFRFTEHSCQRLECPAEKFFSQTRSMKSVPYIMCAGYLSDTNTSTYAVPEQLLSDVTSAFSFSRPAPQAFPPSGVGIQPAYRSQQDIDALSGTASTRQPTAGGLLRYDSGNREMLSLLRGVDDGGVYSAVPGDPSFDVDNVQLNEIERGSLTFVEKIGEGLFGEVTRCKTSVV